MNVGGGHFKHFLHVNVVPLSIMSGPICDSQERMTKHYSNTFSRHTARDVNRQGLLNDKFDNSKYRVNILACLLTVIYLHWKPTQRQNCIVYKKGASLCSLQPLLDIFSDPGNIQEHTPELHTYMHVALYFKCPLLFSDFNQNLNVTTTFRNPLLPSPPISNFTKMCSAGLEMLQAQSQIQQR